MTWQKYYDVVCVVDDVYEKTHKKYRQWVICYNKNCEREGEVAYFKFYRNERLAIRGAERLFRRELGQMEALLGLQK